jgi:hypothetical protein
MRSGVVAATLVMALVAAPCAWAVEQTPGFSNRLSTWTAAARHSRPVPDTVSSYRLGWQRELLAFQLSYGRRLESERSSQPVDTIETGSINRY